MTQTPGGSSKSGYVVIVIGIVEVALAVGLAVFSGLWWVLLLGLLAIPNFVVGFRSIREADRNR